ncbi:delta-aminolevulinic acid dehydratase [Bacillus cereus]|uniref:delta-aminolevulinic acid dehydratase n=1 Tax=unclassified Bacillus (in: firmicutes) TaxID=185979 RepID=UPI00055437D4|nr:MULTISPECIES: delta-aminolevulinic acid dehydratase [unclassified Bacillus (in: firmicutes)]PFE05487.1 delta-aminolevulinic acid dehydratase [Bacillus sp. AFS023182]PGY04645.1 delta-aminolevulinic acid dehydratase [Bacillus cereus]
MEVFYLNIALVVGDNSDLEAQSLRATLEYFGARVITYWIGRPQDLMDVLSGKSLYEDMDYIIFCFHGEEGEFVMGELGEDIYEEDEPRGNFGVAEIKQYAKLHNKYIINSGCTLGDPKLATAFLNSGVKVYIGSTDYVDGNAALMFTIRLFYGLINHQKTIDDAFQDAKLLDDETLTFELYRE